jgi:hypothetical protein
MLCGRAALPPAAPALVARRAVPPPAVQAVLVQELRWQQGSTARDGAAAGPDSAAFSAKQAYLVAAEAVAVLQLQAALLGGDVPMLPPCPAPSEGDVRAGEVREGAQIGLASSQRMQCSVCFKRGEERAAYFAVEGLPSAVKAGATPGEMAWCCLFWGATAVRWAAQLCLRRPAQPAASAVHASTPASLLSLQTWPWPSRRWCSRWQLPHPCVWWQTQVLSQRRGWSCRWLPSWELSRSWTRATRAGCMWRQAGCWATAHWHITGGCWLGLTSSRGRGSWLPDTFSRAAPVPAGSPAAARASQGAAGLAPRECASQPSQASAQVTHDAFPGHHPFQWPYWLRPATKTLPSQPCSGHWVLSFPDGDRAASAKQHVEEWAHKMRAVYCQLLHPLLSTPACSGRAMATQPTTEAAVQEAPP